MTTQTDRIEKKILLHAPRQRVWQALTDSQQFGAWFGMRCDDPFVAGAVVRGAIVPTTVDADIAKRQEGYAGRPVELMIARIEPERLFAFRWHPFAVEPGVDYSAEPTTLVEFTLAEVATGILLTVTESGFDGVPLERRARAFTANQEGWGLVITLLEKYLAAPR